MRQLASEDIGWMMDQQLILDEDFDRYAEGEGVRYCCYCWMHPVCASRSLCRSGTITSTILYQSSQLSINHIMDDGIVVISKQQLT